MNRASFEFDRNQNPIVVGDCVKVIEIPAWLPEGLPNEDQIAIYAQISKNLVIEGFDKDGRAELEFIDDFGNIHTIWIEPKYLEKQI